ncbi:DNA polymerase III subunit chi [Maricaulis alexandrii]|jgi:DNA polymerase III subunit chi|uniref:DNA polymerase III subunit chi n=1 Tax=Maricaulis alexandrii TaxID=2570354 RepID=UPI001109CEEC|nr:DNA polymerase III subunit chi [Maricaulis alexandrii]
MSAELWFYHLEQSSLDEVLPELLEKTLARGWRALVRSPDARHREALDKHLWTWREESFIPHAQAGEGEDARQPVLIAEDEANPNQAQCLFLLDGAEPVNPDAFERMIVMFDGHDEMAVQDARSLWKTASGQGITVSYWRQSPEGRWEKKA